MYLNARVVESGGPTVCPGFQFIAEDSGILFDDSNVDLAPFAGQILALRGIHVLSVLCPDPILEVLAVEPATATLEICGTPRAGCPLRFRVGPPTISLDQVWASLGPQGFLPLGDPLGTLLLQPPFFFVGSHGPAGSFDVNVPNLVGVPVDFQAFHLEVGPIVNDGSLSNPARIHISPPGGPFCLDPGFCF